MPYKPIEFSHIQDPVLKKILLHSDMMLHDLYHIFKLPPEDTIHGGAGNYSITVVLLSIIDGLSVYFYPTSQIDNQAQRFKKLMRDKLPWGPTKKKWLEKGKAAKQFYLELRNPLVHELGVKKPGQRAIFSNILSCLYWKELLSATYLFCRCYEDRNRLENTVF